MSEIRFYHLRTTTLERALPQILEKILARGDKAVVMAGSSERVEALNATLWTYDDKSFLPHGSGKDGFAADQPIWLTTEEENPNGATVLVMTDGATVARIDGWKLALEFFDGGDETALTAARARCKTYKEFGHYLTYCKQRDQGKWEKAG